MLKPRSEASAIGIRKLQHEDELWPLLTDLGDKQSYFVLEKFLPGDVYHVDGIISESQVLFAEAHKYGLPPMQVSQEGGIFVTATVDRASQESRDLHTQFNGLMRALGFVRGVTHTEFICAHADGQFYFLEAAARVGGAYISDVIEAATGIDLWREWARIEVLGAKYQLALARQDHAGIILTLARQEYPDTSAYDDLEIVARPGKRHHAGLIVKSENAQRVSQLLESYSQRFTRDYYTSQPAPAEKPTD